MSLYKKNEWKEFRKIVIELDNYTCTTCGKTEKDGAILQVHHVKYIEGRKPWEYGTKDCVTLCKGCHAAEHGIIKPKIGWQYLGEYDLEDLIGTCDYCGSSLRYSFTIFHENWGTIEVGTVCCDNLTDSNIASNLRESQSKYEGRKKRFLSSKRWKLSDNIHSIKQGQFVVEIGEFRTGYYLQIHGQKSKIVYESLECAKLKAFDVIESDELIEYFKLKGIKYPEIKNNKNKITKTQNHETQ